MLPILKGTLVAPSPPSPAFALSPVALSAYSRSDPRGKRTPTGEQPGLGPLRGAKVARCRGRGAALCTSRPLVPGEALGGGDSCTQELSPRADKGAPSLLSMATAHSSPALLSRPHPPPWLTAQGVSPGSHRPRCNPIRSQPASRASLPRAAPG